MTCTKVDRWEGKEEEGRNSILEWVPSRKKKTIREKTVKQYETVY